MRLRSTRLGLAAALALATASAWADVTVDHLRSVLATNSVALPADHREDSAVLALLESIDPRAMIVPRSDSNLIARLQGRGAMAGSSVSTGEHWTVSAAELGLLYVKPEGTHASGLSRLTNTLGTTNAGAHFLILDLRQASGFDAHGLALAAGHFLSNAAPLSTWHIAGAASNTATSARLAETRWDHPLTVLIDDSTQGGAIALCAALTQRQGVLSIGTAMDTDNRIRDLLHFDDEHLLYVGIGHFSIPSAPNWPSVAIAPDIVVETDAPMSKQPVSDGLDDRDIDTHDQRRRALLRAVSDDSILKRAVDVFIGLDALGQHEVSTE